MSEQVCRKEWKHPGPTSGEIRETEKSSRDAEKKTDDISGFVFDLKAENPNIIVNGDERTPLGEIPNS